MVDFRFLNYTLFGYFLENDYKLRLETFRDHKQEQLDMKNAFRIDCRRFRRPPEVV